MFGLTVVSKRRLREKEERIKKLEVSLREASFWVPIRGKDGKFMKKSANAITKSVCAAK